MPTFASGGFGAACLALAGCLLSLSPADARVVERLGVASVRSEAERPSRRAAKAPSARAAARNRARTPPPPEPTQGPDKNGAVSTAWTTAEPSERSCLRVRRKLWQDDQGWVVKTVKICP